MKSVDKNASRLLRRIQKAKASGRELNLLRDKFASVVQRIVEDDRDALVRVFNSLSAVSETPNATPLHGSVELLRELIAKNYQDCASVLFSAEVQHFQHLSASELAPITPNPTCVDRWVKIAKPNKRLLMKSVAAAADEYYPTAWGDWIAKKGPPKELLRLCTLAVDGRDRPNYLQTSIELLSSVLRRDKKDVLSDSLSDYAASDSAKITALLNACFEVPAARSAYSSSLGFALSTNAAIAEPVIEALTAFVHGKDESKAKFASSFAAHMTSNLGLLDYLDEHDENSGITLLMNFATSVWQASESLSDRDLWVTANVQLIKEQISKAQGEISLNGALQMALGLRASQSDLTARDALWSTAFNLGIREIGEEKGAVTFDPSEHEDVKGGLLRGDRARIINCGWKLGKQVLLRAEVEAIGMVEEGDDGA